MTLNMEAMEDIELLREYAQHQSEPAFTELVSRHINFVYSTALRVVRDSQLAEDVAQLVFIRLARKAGSLSDRAILSGWLYRTTQFVSLTVLRSDWRRRERENTAMQLTELNRNSESVWKEVAPFLDEALTRLGKVEQDAVLLRFFSGKSLREIGDALGISEDAAQKRVNRALEKMRGYFMRHGAVVPAAAIIPAVSTHALQAAPAGLASTLISTSLSGGEGTVFGITTWTFAKGMILAKLKTVGFVIGGLALFTAALVVVRTQRDSPFVVRGIVRTPDGRPVAGALVRVATSDSRVRLYETNSSSVSVITGDDGSFSIRLSRVPPEGKAVVAVTDDRGYAVATAAELSANSNIIAQPWGRIEGVLRKGKSVAPNERVNIGIWGSPENYEWDLAWHGASVQTDPTGRFIFPRVAAGDVWLTHTVAVQPGDERQSGHLYVRVAPGSRMQLQLGGVGSTIVGRVERNPGERLIFYGSMWANQTHFMRPPEDWSTMSFEEKRQYERSWRDSPEGEEFKKEVRNYEFSVQPDGTFKIEDVLPGSYQMQVRADAPLRKGESARLAASAETRVDVPETSKEGKFDGAIDVGVLSPQRLVLE
jgi:RNA polymerase sigma factor (sigma-70 family)